MSKTSRLVAKGVQRLRFEADLRLRLRWAVHNAVAHPLMVLLPRSAGEWLHEVTEPRVTAGE